MRTLLLGAALAIALPAAAQAPDTLALAPGSALATDWIAPGTRDYTIKLVAPMQQNVGTATETITVGDDGVVTRVTRIWVPTQGVEQTDSLRAEAATLAPLTHHSTGGPAEVSVEFMPEGVVGMVTPRTGEAATVTLLTDAPVFDAGWIGEVAQSLPLEEGTVARLEGFTAQSPDAPVEAVLTVAGQETVTTPAGDRAAWTVEADLGTMRSTYVVDAETREMLVTRFSPQPGVTIEIAPVE